MNAALFDSHCHLDSPELAARLPDVLARARAAGVDYLVTIGSGYGPDEAAKAVDIATRHENVWATVGIHPHDAAKSDREILQKLKDLARNPKVVAWGEIGLDYHYDHSPRDVQNQVFREQIDLALDLDLPISLHVREAAVDLLVHLRDVKVQAGDALRGIWHCFTETPEAALEAIDLGFFISIPGIVTFPAGANVRKAVEVVPLDRMVVETDSPFLAPVPYRGKTNEPAFLVETVKKIAEIKGASFSEVAAITTANARIAYGIPEGTGPEAC